MKRIELTGFKSFKDKTVLDFEKDITGIVGPNGCGKSNIADAVRWALGEQSNKSLRAGSSRSDIVFAGSKDHSPSSLASVALTFDNRDHIFPVAYEEVEIMRRYYTHDQKSVYYLNHKPCQLQEITNLILDTGLGRDSLSIITQGNIISFADAKPEARRGLFEEAAGVARYRRRKRQSESRLDQTQENLNRIRDILEELQSRLPELDLQASEAREFQQKQERLRLLQLALLIHDIRSQRDQLKRCQEYLEHQEQDKTALSSEMESLEKQIEENREQLFQADQNISSLQGSLDQVRTERFELEKELAVKREQEKFLALQHDPALEKQRLYKEMEQKKLEEKRLEEQLQEHKKEHADRENEYSSLQRTEQNLQKKIRANQSELYSLERKKNQLQSRLEEQRPSFLDSLLSQKGIEGRIQDLFHYESGYEQALEAALGGNRNHLIARTQKDAAQAISFLKKNHLPRQTFYPLDTLQPPASFPLFEKARRETGALGSADEFVQSDPDYDIVKKRLTGQILVVDTMEHAMQISRKFSQKIRMTTLEGDLFLAGGAMSGGGTAKKRDLSELHSLQQKISENEEEHKELSERLQQTEQTVQKLRQDGMDLLRLLQLEQQQLDQVKPAIKALQEQLNTLQEVETDSVREQLEQQLVEITEIYNSKQQELTARRQEKQDLSTLSQKLDASLRNLQRKSSHLQKEAQQMELNQAKAETALDKDLFELNSKYHLTLQKALETLKNLEFPSLEKMQVEIRTLEKELEGFGEINAQALRQYTELKERSDFLEHQLNDLSQARADLLKAISQLDQKMKEDFLDMFHKINEQLNPVFRSMFGGGSARLILTDEKDPLHCGIDLEAHPPGKRMKGLQAYSGGEKALIAISVLFSILKAKRIPLCIFDEVEAALDVANVDRFARYVQQFKDKSQFIIITHRQGTMEKCEQLFGVTMAKNGVSRVLAVELED